MGSAALIASTALGISLAAATRSTWSPCGLSMISSLNPLGERARGQRYPLTASCFVLGALAGGAALGLLAAALAEACSAAGLGGSRAALGIGAVLALGAAVVDSSSLLPVVRRQVDERWLDRYRGWAYGIGYGWQVGTGLATYVMTAGVALTVALGALTGLPLVAFFAAVAFGGARGLAVLVTLAARTPVRLRSLLASFDRLERPSRAGMVLMQVVAGALLAGWLWPPAAALVVAAAAAAAFQVVGRFLPKPGRPG